MNKIMYSWIVAIICLGTASSSWAVTYYIDNAGDDNNNGLSLSSPFATLNRARQFVDPGDVIEMRGGVYAGSTVGRRGTEQNWITLRPYNNEKVIIDGTGRSIALYFYNDAFSPMYWIVEGLEIRGGSVYVIKIDTAKVRVLNNNLHSSRRDIVKLVRTANDVEIAYNEIHYTNIVQDNLQGANAQGVDIVGADRTWVHHNYVHDIPSIGMYAKGNARNTIFENNRLENIMFRGIMLGQSTDANLLVDGPFESYDGIVRNNIFKNTGGACLASSASFNAKFLNNSCIDAATNAHAAIYLSNESELGTATVNIQIKNNIIVSSTNTNRPVIKVNANALLSPAELDLDSNIYWTPNGGTSVRFLWDGLGLFNVPFNTWRASTGQDSSSIVADPLFKNINLLTIERNSPAVNAGLTLPEVPTDYLNAPRPAGNSYDIGAYELDIVTDNDFNGDLKSDIPLYRSDAGGVRIWEMNGGSITSNTFSGALGTNFQIQGFADTNNDGNEDIIWLDASTGAVRIWLMNGGTVTNDISVGSLGGSWVLKEIGDFNNDNQADILWHRPDTGGVRLWLINNGALQSNTFIGGLPSSWEIRGLADVNNDSQQDIVWRDTNTSGIRIWHMNGSSLVANAFVGSFGDTNWTTVGFGDFNNDGNDDILFSNTSNGAVRVWEMSGTALQANQFVAVFPVVWTVENVADYNNDGTEDILWQHSDNGGIRLWPMLSSALISNSFVGTFADTNWLLRGHGDYDGGGNSDILWQNQTTGAVRMWLMNGATINSNLFVGLTNPFVVQKGGVPSSVVPPAR